MPAPPPFPYVRQNQCFLQWISHSLSWGRHGGDTCGTSGRDGCPRDRPHRLPGSGSTRRDAAFGSAAKAPLVFPAPPALPAVPDPRGLFCAVNSGHHSSVTFLLPYLTKRLNVTCRLRRALTPNKKANNTTARFPIKRFAAALQRSNPGSVAPRLALPHREQCGAPPAQVPPAAPGDAHCGAARVPTAPGAICAGGGRGGGSAGREVVAQGGWCRRSNLPLTPPRCARLVSPTGF